MGKNTKDVNVEDVKTNEEKSPRIGLACAFGFHKWGSDRRCTKCGARK